MRPLREISAALTKKPLHLFEIPRTYQHKIKQVDGYRFPASGMFMGKSRPYGALITYYIEPSQVKQQSEKADRPMRDRNRHAPDRNKKKPKVKIEILDSSGKVVRKMDGPMERGINRVAWNLRTDGFKFPFLGERQRRRFTPQGPEVLPGVYAVKIKMGEHEVSGQVQVLPDPRVDIPLADRKEKFDTIRRVGQKIEIITEVVNRVKTLRKRIDQVLEQVKDRDDDAAKDLKKAARRLKKRLMKVVTQFVDPPDREGIYPRDRTVIAKLGYVARSLSTSYDKPTQAQLTYLRQAEALLEKRLADVNQVLTTDVAAFREKVQAANLELVPEYQPLDLNWTPKKK
ncbi:MAG: hypothetical protein Q9P14_06830 [candidate division KSB1 bacterium]|nr:hypothetical protein [candidate division KSB1 bacterium]